jgi:hypothetical protein
MQNATHSAAEATRLRRLAYAIECAVACEAEAVEAAELAKTRESEVGRLMAAARAKDSAERAAHWRSEAARHEAQAKS